MVFNRQSWTFTSKISAAAVAAALALVPAGTALGQSSSSHYPRSGGHDLDPRVPSTVSDYETTSIVNNIAAVRNECGQYDPIYRIDCLSKGLAEVARRMPQNGEYTEARRIIAEAAGKLQGVQNKHADTAAPEQESRDNVRFPAKRVYKAVKREKLAEAMEEANKIIEEAETKLLRAAENSEKRSAHYQEIAAAVGSTKVLLRSA